MVADYLITTLKMSGLKVSGSTPYVNAQSMAVRKDWAPLAGILDKALDSISETERNEIYRQWLPELYKQDFDYRFLWWALGIFAVILLVSAAWIWQLQREITRRKRAEIDASASERRFRQLFTVAPMPLVLSDRVGALTLVNDRWKQTFGYTHNEIPTIRDWWRLANPDSDYRRRVIDTWEATVRHALETENDRVEFQENRVTCKNGDVRIMEISGIFIDDDLLVAFYDITDRKRTTEDLERQRKELEQRLHQTVNAISKIGEIRDVYTSGHQKRVAELACAIGSEMGLPDERINALSIGGLIHDIGQMFIPSDILNKPGKITDLEYRIIQTHAEKSYNVVKQIDFPAEIPTMIYQHHERLDGTGYPRRLSGDEIILESRILAVADVVEAMSSHRSYRPALGIDAALEEILRYRGTKYDAEVVDVCMKLFKENGFAFQSTQIV